MKYLGRIELRASAKSMFNLRRSRAIPKEHSGTISRISKEKFSAAFCELGNTARTHQGISNETAENIAGFPFG